MSGCLIVVCVKHVLAHVGKELMVAWCRFWLVFEWGNKLWRPQCVELHILLGLVCV